MNLLRSRVLSLGLVTAALGMLGACSDDASSAATAATDSSAATANTPAEAVTAATAATAATVTITGGDHTVDGDGGRPVVLVASLLGVEPEVFRAAFGRVTPARGAEPEAAQVQLNKAALLDVLGPYGVTNDALDSASNTYRYSSAQGETWAHRDATASASVVDGAVTVTVEDGGRGYTSAPSVTITLADGSTLDGTATVTYTDDFETNGSITAITVE